MTVLEADAITTDRTFRQKKTSDLLQVGNLVSISKANVVTHTHTHQLKIAVLPLNEIRSYLIIYLIIVSKCVFYSDKCVVALGLLIIN